MKFSAIVFGLLFSLNANSAVIVPNESEHEALTIKAVHTIEDLMPVIGPGVRNGTYSLLSVDVMSSGCTKAEDFEVHVQNMGEGQEVLVERKREDRCDAEPHVIEVQLRADEPIVGPVNVINPLLVKFSQVH